MPKIYCNGKFSVPWEERSEWDKYHNSWEDIPRKEAILFLLRTVYGEKEYYTYSQVKEVIDNFNYMEDLKYV